MAGPRAPFFDASRVAPMATDPTLSAVVVLHPNPDEGSNQGRSQQEVAAIAKAKAHFTQAGFEVHAPLGLSFSIGAKRSHFEGYFGDRLVMDEEGLFGAVTTERGGPELSLDSLPEDVRPLVDTVTFPPAPDVGPLPA